MAGVSLGRCHYVLKPPRAKKSQRSYLDVSGT